MKVTETPLQGVLIVEPSVYSDSRGYFFESWQQKRYIEVGIETEFVQDNESQSVQGVVRGLHYQLAPWGQAKLVRVVQGRIFDVAVDLRQNSPTFMKWFGVELDDTSKKQLFIPRGFAHGFSVLSETAIFAYKCDNVFNREADRTINLKDPQLNINWKLGEIVPIVSDKDKNAPFLKDAEINFK
ncbi:MAG TPA: dTDP-4-dehydrorhamnose 3,5-epimerase [Mariniphaga sp.]|nr:dTDP-4-dehydrorhamnose 3,5-epimerase [Mariniphaga sp.]